MTDLHVPQLSVCVKEALIRGAYYWIIEGEGGLLAGSWGEHVVPEHPCSVLVHRQGWVETVQLKGRERENK